MFLRLSTPRTAKLGPWDGVRLLSVVSRAALPVDPGRQYDSILWLLDVPSGIHRVLEDLIAYPSKPVNGDGGMDDGRQ